MTRNRGSFMDAAQREKMREREALESGLMFSRDRLIEMIAVRTQYYTHCRHSCLCSSQCFPQRGGGGCCPPFQRASSLDVVSGCFDLCIFMSSPLFTPLPGGNLSLIFSAYVLITALHCPPLPFPLPPPPPPPSCIHVHTCTLCSGSGLSGMSRC